MYNLKKNERSQQPFLMPGTETELVSELRNTRKIIKPQVDVIAEECLAAEHEFLGSAHNPLKIHTEVVIALGKNRTNKKNLGILGSQSFCKKCCQSSKSL